MIRSHRDFFAATSLAEHFGVVDLTNVEMGPSRPPPGLANTACGNQVIGRPREQEQQRAPVLGPGVRPDGQPADQSLMKEHGELTNGRVGAERRTAIDGEEFAVNGEVSRGRHERGGQ